MRGPGPACVHASQGPAAARGRRDPTLQAGLLQLGSERICCRGHCTPGYRLRWRASPGGGCENLVTVPARLHVLAPPRLRGRPAPGPARARPLSGPRPGPRPSADAPLAGSAPRACPQALAGSAPPLGGSCPPRRSGTSLLRPLGNYPGRPGPASGTDTRYGAHLCARLRGPSAPRRTPRPAPGFVRLEPSGVQGRGGWGRRARSRGGLDSAEEVEAGDRVPVWAASCSLASLPLVPPGGPESGVSRCRP